MIRYPCVCGATTGLRLYISGWRCPAHTPAALAGRPEPDASRPDTSSTHHPTTKEKNTMSDTPAPWFVIAGLCGCGLVAPTVMEAALVADATPSSNPNEIIAAGDDWRALVTETATTLARRTGRRIQPTCTAVFVRDDTEREALETELTVHTYSLLEELSDPLPLSV